MRLPLFALAAALSGPGLALAAEASGTVALDDLAFRRGTLTIAIPHLEALGTALTAGDLRDILDPSSALPPDRRLARLTAASITAPEVTFRRDPKPGEAEGQAVTLHGVRLTGIVAGKAAALSIASLDGSLRRTATERDAVSTDAIAAHAVDPLLALDMATGSRTDAALPVSTVCGDLSVSDLRLRSSDGGALLVEKVEAAGLRGRPLLDSPSNILHLFDLAPDLMSAADKTRSFDLLVDVVASAALDRLAVSNSSFASGTGGVRAFHVGRLVLSDLRPTSLGRLEIGDVTFKAGGLLAAMRSALASNVEGSTAMQSLLARSLEFQPAGGLASPPAGTMHSEASMEGLELDIPSDGGGPFPPGTVNHVEVPLVESGASTSPGTGVVEGHLRAKVRYDMPPGGGDPTLRMIRDLGLDRIDASLGYGITYDANAGTMRLDDLSVEGRDIGRVALSGTATALPTAGPGAATTREQQAALLADARFQSLSATVVDRGLLGRVVAVMARQGAVTPAQLRAGLMGQVDLHLPELLGRSKTEAGVASAIDRFLDAGGTLEMTARSSAGMTFREMGEAADPASVAGRLDIAATAHP